MTITVATLELTKILIIKDSNKRDMSKLIVHRAGLVTYVLSVFIFAVCTLPGPEPYKRIMFLK